MTPPLTPPPSGISFGDATRTPVAYGGKPACSAGLTASEEGMETEYACQQSRSNTQFPRRFRSPNRVKKGAKILFPPFLRGD